MSPQHALRFTAVAAVALVAACQDAPSPVAPTLPDPSLSVQGGASAGQARLVARFNEASAAVLALAGTVFADHDEIANKLVFGVENRMAIHGVQTALARIGLADSDYSVVVTEPIYQVATLRDRFRPTQAGIQIHFSQYVCTLGFNVDHSGGRSFITNSHCTATQGGTEGTVYYQPVSSTDPTVIATEAADPTYFRGGACPRGRKCRYSDAARALYSSSVASERGFIAKTTGANNNSLTVSSTTPNFTITSQANVTSGTVNKVGRTTGWTQGNITATCVNTNVSGSNVTQLCQTFVSAGVGGGDSGSPVFRITSGDNVQLVGILWGGSSNGQSFVYSPISQIVQELGPLNAMR